LIIGIQILLTKQTHDAINRLAQITQTGTNVVDKRVNLNYNAISQITKINRYASLDTSVPVTSTTHTYDQHQEVVIHGIVNAIVRRVDYEFSKSFRNSSYFRDRSFSFR
jgi:hypothetical protein